MGWEKRGKKTFFYSARRVGNKVVKTYCGSGVVGRVAEQVERRRRAERDEQRVAYLAEQTRLEEAQERLRQFGDCCEQLTVAALLCSGFHRPNRRPWRRCHAVWRAARQAV